MFYATFDDRSFAVYAYYYDIDDAHKVPTSCTVLIANLNSDLGSQGGPGVTRQQMWPVAPLILTTATREELEGIAENYIFHATDKTWEICRTRSENERNKVLRSIGPYTIDILNPVNDLPGAEQANGSEKNYAIVDLTTAVDLATRKANEWKGVTGNAAVISIVDELWDPPV